MPKAGLPGEGAFRKLHKDTSRWSDVFESFATFPVPRKGVELVLWHDVEQERASKE